MKECKAAKREIFFVDIKNRKEREEFLDKILEFGGFLLKSNDEIGFEKTREEIIDSIFPIVIDFKKLEIDFIKNTTCASAAVMDKSKFITAEEVLDKIKMSKY